MGDRLRSPVATPSPAPHRPSSPCAPARNLAPWRRRSPTSWPGWARSATPFRATIGACTVSGDCPWDGTIPDDYRRTDDILASIEAEVRQSLLTGLGRERGEAVESLVHLVGSWSLEEAREAAWVRVRALWVLRERPELFARSVGASIRTVGMTGRHLLTPPLPPARRAVA